MTTVHVDNVTHAPGGDITIHHDGGQSFTLSGGVVGAQDFADSLDELAVAKWFIVKRYLLNSPDLSDDSSIEGKAAIINHADTTNPVTIS